MQKLTTDVSEFAVGEEKVYLSPILDMYNGEIIAYDISRHPDFKQTMDMLDRAFEKIPDNSGENHGPKSTKILSWFDFHCTVQSAKPKFG